MTTEQEWKDLPTMKDVANVPEGWEIEIYGTDGWETWHRLVWASGSQYRARPRQPKTKTITLRKALIKGASGYYTDERDDDSSFWPNFVCWLGEPYTVEVPE